MRRTAWDYIWIAENDLDFDNIEAQAAKLEEEQSLPQPVSTEDKGKQPEADSDIDESSHWGTDGVGVKVWLRRTVIYQLINLMERIVF